MFSLIDRMVLPGDPSVLQLNGVTREDSGEYICQVGFSSSLGWVWPNIDFVLVYPGGVWQYIDLVFGDRFDFRL